MLSASANAASAIAPLAASISSKPLNPAIPLCICHWSKWLDFGTSTIGPKGGKLIPVKAITDAYPIICSKPQKVECRSKLYPALALSQLGQTVTCNLEDGLVCLNKNQSVTQQCFDYEMRLLCCHEECVSATLPAAVSLVLNSSSTSVRSTTAPPKRDLAATISETFPSHCICQWSNWVNNGSLTTGPKGGKLISIKFITDTYPTTCSKPQKIECRAKLYPGFTLSKLGQAVTCNLEDGLVCLNKNQSITQQCFDYEMRLLCCHEECVSATLPEAITLALRSSSSSVSTTTAPPSQDINTTISKTLNSKCICQWSDWVNFGSPTTGPEGGKLIPVKFITDTYPTTCSKPQEIECRAKRYPGLALSQLGQAVTCNLKNGVVCLNKNQSITQQCFDYEMRLLCCHEECVSATLPAAITLALRSSFTSVSTTTLAPRRDVNTTISKTINSKCICQWSDWWNFGSPTTGPKGGELIPVKLITNTYPTICSKPQKIECRAKLYPGLALSQLGQTVKCNLEDGLVCLNKNQSNTQQCFDYEMRLLCCHEECVSATLPEAITLALRSSSTNVNTTTVPPKRDVNTTISKTMNSKCICQWSNWVNFGSPTTGPEGGKLIPVKVITDTYPTTCSKPQEIECRAKLYPGLSLSQLGQTVMCNLEDGLVCLNKNQSITQQCFDYEMRLLCCHEECVSATLPAAITLALRSSSRSISSTTVPPRRDMAATISKTFPSSCICKWSDWMDFGSPTTGPEGGEILPMTKITNTYSNICPAPTKAECRAKHYPGVLLSQLGQVVTCNSQEGLVCLNKNQHVTQQCFDYEIKVLCCQGPCGKSSKISPRIQRLSYSAVVTPPSLPDVTVSSGGHITAHHDCVCEVYGNTFNPESEIYNITDGDGWCYIAKCVKIEERCDVKKISGPCLTTVFPAASVPLTGNCEKHTPPLTNGESVKVGNCLIGTCMNGYIQYKAVDCDPVQYPVCENKFSPLNVSDESGCCFKHECQCICNGFRDLHYITFDGIYYPFQGNSSLVLVQEIDSKYNFSVVVDNICDIEDDLSCPKSLVVHYKSFKIFMTQRVSAGAVINLIYLNNKKVRLPFQYEDVRATETGMESIVVLSEIDTQISFTGTMFSIHLPWQKFNGNTEGLCGVCDNNQINDCRLPNGTIISSCQEMASYWHAHDSKNSKNLLPPRPESTSVSSCAYSAMCKIIEHKIFEKCHRFVPVEPYVSACTFDVCNKSNATIGCASLQAYAHECAMAGVCVDWRDATNGVCDFKCKSPQRYLACGPQVEPTCDERFNQEHLHGNNAFSNLESMLWEGCYCPSGTTRLRRNSNICVPSCEFKESITTSFSYQKHSVSV
ncbi:mucin-5AC [Danio aesculapii]|uniref:mucin-5AC n=1 Tax=Danio aesculapii TaxID=1142201 RepID=UPI0024C030CF|nr:mucin-5AC [Danio aesculapii]